MKLAISGKGGVGKTTLSALLAQYFADQGKDVLAVDADPSPCLAGALGLPGELRAKLSPIAEMDQLIEERTGAKPGTTGGFFTLNPRVDDIPERFSVTHRNVRLLEMGSVDLGGSGCICPESALLRALVMHIVLARDEVVVMDMEAGIEHLGRSTAKAVDKLIVVVEPGRRSIDTAEHIRKLAGEIGLNHIAVVGNKVRSAKDEKFLQTHLNDFEFLGFCPYDEALIEADLNGTS
ncbi:MAG: carbon monoxide dehydrogenase accessory protein CooC, partial [Anaerolineales bacterium]